MSARIVLVGVGCGLLFAVLVEVQAHYTRFDLNLPIPVIRAGAVAVAPVNNLRDSDGHLRRGLTALRVGDQMPVGFGAAIHRIARGAGLPAAPMPREPSFLINFRGGPKTFPWLSYYQVLRGEVGPEAFRGKIVLIGATSEILHDISPRLFCREITSAKCPVSRTRRRRSSWA